MHVPKPELIDLGSRRRLAGALRETMAAGLGLEIEEIRAIEDGTASIAVRIHYAGWLDRIEAWTDDHRAGQLFAAGAGRRFDP